MLGAHERTHQGVDGVSFAVWAPAARGVAVVGDFNNWDPAAPAMRPLGSSGVWESFVARHRRRAALQVRGPRRRRQRRLKADPWRAHRAAAGHRQRRRGEPLRLGRRGLARRAAPPPTSSTGTGGLRGAPRVVAAGRDESTGPDGRPLTYASWPRPLAEHVTSLGFTHVELMPVAEHPFGGSWGYQVTGYYAPTSRFGTPDDFRSFVDRWHQRGIGRDPRLGAGALPQGRVGAGPLRRHRALRARRPAPGRASRLGHAHLQLRPQRGAKFPGRQRAVLVRGVPHRRAARGCGGLDAVSRLLAASRRVDPEPHGGRENLEAIAFLQEINSGARRARRGAHDRRRVHRLAGGCRPVHNGGLGFSLKWNMGWMHDMLRYFARTRCTATTTSTTSRSGHVRVERELRAAALSHDEVVHGKGSLIDKMPGDQWQRFANLRALLGVHVGAIPARSCCSWAARSARTASGTTTAARLAAARPGAARGRAATSWPTSTGCTRRAGAVGRRLRAGGLPLDRGRRRRPPRCCRSSASIPPVAAGPGVRGLAHAHRAPGLPGRRAARRDLGDAPRHRRPALRRERDRARHRRGRRRALRTASTTRSSSPCRPSAWSGSRHVTDSGSASNSGLLDFWGRICASSHTYASPEAGRSASGASAGQSTRRGVVGDPLRHAGGGEPQRAAVGVERALLQQPVAEVRHRRRLGAEQPGHVTARRLAGAAQQVGDRREVLLLARRRVVPTGLVEAHGQVGVGTGSAARAWSRVISGAPNDSRQA